MREIAKLSFILMLISGLAAGSLAYVNQVTSKVIAEREAREKIARMLQIFPGAASLEEKTVEGQTATLALDGAGQVVGLLTVSSVAGYAGPINFSLALDGEGKIVSVGVISHSETPGIGDKIEQQPFLDQFAGKAPAAPLAVGQDIDNISGATVSVNALTSGVRQALLTTVSRFLGK